MKSFFSRIRYLPIEIKRLLSIAVVLALVVALPLFIWAIVTQRFELRKRAATGEATPSPVATADFCLGKPNNTSCSICPPCVYSIPRCLAPCIVGTCQNQTCVSLLNTIAFTPSQLDFGPIPTGTSVQKPFSLKNNSATSSGQILITLSGTNAKEFSFITKCQGATLQPYESCLVYLTFSPTTIGTGKSATLIATATPGGKATVALSGSGISACGPDCGTPPPNPCLGLNEGQSCAICPPSVCFPASPNGPGSCETPGLPCTEGVCQKGQCSTALSCPNGDKGNLDCDSQGLINVVDLSILLSKWGPSPINNQGGHAPADLNADGKVNVIDLSILLSNWKSS